MPLKTHCFSSPLRYPGGKGMLANFVKLTLSRNNLQDGHYVEVFAGGASIAWTLLFEEYVQQVHVNDISKPVFAFWSSAVNQPEDLCRLIRDSNVNIDEWHRQKSIQKNPQNHSQLEIGFSTFFLNRTNRSGILNGGVIGGKGQTGTWKLDARFNKTDLIDRIQRIARYASRINLYNEDAADFIHLRLPKISKNSLVYFDPPYYVKGQGLYENYYSHDDHLKIAQLITKRVKQPWIVSYDDAPEILEMYAGFQMNCYKLSYSAQERYSGSEVMFFSKNLIVPDVTHPAKVKAKPGLVFAFA